jgi:hypothetical protein
MIYYFYKKAVLTTCMGNYIFPTKKMKMKMKIKVSNTTRFEALTQNEDSKLN